MRAICGGSEARTCCGTEGAFCGCIGGEELPLSGCCVEELPLASGIVGAGVEELPLDSCLS